MINNTVLVYEITDGKIQKCFTLRPEKNDSGFIKQIFLAISVKLVCIRLESLAQNLPKVNTQPFSKS